MIVTEELLDQTATVANFAIVQNEILMNHYKNTC